MRFPTTFGRCWIGVQERWWVFSLERGSIRFFGGLAATVEEEPAELTW